MQCHFTWDEATKPYNVLTILIFATDHGSKHVMLDKPLTGQIIHAPGIWRIYWIKITFRWFPRKLSRPFFPKSFCVFNFEGAFFQRLILWHLVTHHHPFSYQKKCTTSRVSRRFVYIITIIIFIHVINWVILFLIFLLNRS